MRPVTIAKASLFQTRPDSEKKRFWNISNNIGAVGVTLLKWGEARNIIGIVHR